MRSRIALGMLGLLAAVALVARITPPRQPAPAGSPAILARAPGGAGIALLVWPDDGETEVIDRVAAARRRVLLKVYLLTDPRMFSALAHARANGADVRVMIEPEPVNGAGAAARALAQLRARGIEAKHASPEFRFTHEKSLVIDDVALILTANLTRASVSRNREFGVLVRLPSDVDEVAAAFDADWRRAAFDPHSPNLAWSPPTSRERIDGVIQAAAAAIDVYAPAAQDQAQLALLASAAQRGVRVRVLTSPQHGEDALEASEPGFDLLRRAGVEVRWLATPFVHAKVFIADGARAFIGSQNMTTTSLDFNRELGILVADAAALRRLAVVFQADWDRAR